MNQLKNFVSNNFRSLFVLMSFVVTIYVQHVTNTSRIVELSEKRTSLEVKVADQYEKIDAIKLDKAVFYATIKQVSSIQNDLIEMRADIKELLKKR